MRRNVAQVLTVGILFSLAFAANAAAQGATLVISPTSVAPGGVVSVTGSGFSTAGGVNIRLSTRDGEPLSSPSPDTRGRFVVNVPIPPSQAPGTYLVIATQVTAQGRQRGFTPGRAKLRIAAGAAAAPPGSREGWPPAALALVALAALGLIALVARRLRTLDRPLFG